MEAGQPTMVFHGVGQTTYLTNGLFPNKMMKENIDERQSKMSRRSTSPRSW